jgi:hypothetical protein
MGWSRYVKATVAVDLRCLSLRKAEKGSDYAEHLVEGVDLTLGIDDAGNVSIFGILPGTPPGDTLLNIEMTTSEAQRLRDLLVWALADIPGTSPPPRSH